MQLLTVTTAVQRLAARGVTLTDQTFRDSLLPHMLERGDAQKLATGSKGSRSLIVIDGSTWWEWETYLDARARLIAAGVWTATRAYSVEDCEDISRDLWDWEEAIEQHRQTADETAQIDAWTASLSKAEHHALWIGLPMLADEDSPTVEHFLLDAWRQKVAPDNLQAFGAAFRAWVANGYK